MGAHVRVADLYAQTAGERGFTVAAYVYPTCRSGRRQVIVGRWSDGERAIGLDAPLETHLWHGMAASYDAATGEGVLVACPQVTRHNSRRSPITVEQHPQVAQDRVAGFVSAGSGELIFGALTADDAHFNGKIEEPGVWLYPSAGRRCARSHPVRTTPRCGGSSPRAAARATPRRSPCRAPATRN